MLPAEIEAEQRSHLLLQRIGGTSPHRSTGGALLVRKVNFESMAVLVLHARLGERLAGPVAEPGKIPPKHVQRGLALDHPFGGKLAEATRLRKPRDQAVAAEVVLE